jgi:Zn-dependent peptidase ImmA (M78 family)/transcriptional regulator with XRE-family HTH domain
MFSKNLRFFRLKSHMSMQQVAEKTGISANAIKKYEHGEMMPASETLESLAAALGVKASLLMQNWATNLSIEPLHRRSRSSRTARSEETIRLAIEIELSRYMVVLSLFSTARLPIPHNVEKQVVESPADIEKAAETVRNLLGLASTGPLPNLIAILEKLGYLVVVVTQPPDWFDAEFGIVNDRPYIAIAASRSPDRQRHTMAHELGHIWLECRNMDEEKTASQFAGALLLPKPDMLRELGEHRVHGIAIDELRLLQQEYRVSMKSIIKRARQLGILGESTEVEEYKRLNGCGFARDEQAGFPMESPATYQKLVAELAMEQEISLSRGAELLGIDLIEMQNRLFGAAIP